MCVWVAILSRGLTSRGLKLYILTMEAMISHTTIRPSQDTLTLHFACGGAVESQNVSYSENFAPSYNLVGARFYDADIYIFE